MPNLPPPPLRELPQHPALGPPPLGEPPSVIIGSSSGGNDSRKENGSASISRLS